MTAKCPVCGKPPVTATRPFCSNRCADVDLHRWLSGGYAIPGAAAEDEEDERPSRNRSAGLAEDAEG